MKKELDYNEALKVVRNYFQSIPNLKRFCEEYDINYTIAIRIKNNKETVLYPDLVLKMLQLLGNEVELVKEYKYKLNNK